MSDEPFHHQVGQYLADLTAEHAQFYGIECLADGDRSFVADVAGQTVRWLTQVDQRIISQTATIDTDSWEPPRIKMPFAGTAARTCADSLLYELRGFIIAETRVTLWPVGETGIPVAAVQVVADSAHQDTTRDEDTTRICPCGGTFRNRYGVLACDQCEKMPIDFAEKIDVYPDLNGEPPDDRIDPNTLIRLLTGEKPTATCPHDHEPLVATMEFRGAEFYCVVCQRTFGFLSPIPATTTPELDARLTELTAAYERERALRLATR